VPIRRLPGYDYSSAGAYFITVCAYRRALLFNHAKAAAAVEACWEEIPSHYPVDPDAFVVMPNHVHGILLFTRAGHARPLQIVVGSFKSATARAINGLRNTPGASVWQRGYYERVIRSDNELETFREYIASNPTAWDADPENPRRTTGDAHAPWL
jgi:putative transposase